ncbi:MAG: hypothetical protein QOJ12_461 [Thermoleophilales bacterium]|nr:hypothetical protein [Thermoleophilales bacterium]
MWGRLARALAIAAALVAAPAAHAQAPGADYCEGDGGPAGMATDAEHTVLAGDPPLPAGVRSSRVVVGGVATRVQEAGPADAADAVVFVHGHPGSSRDWDDLVAANGRFARTVAFDVSGYGQSDKTARAVQSTDGAARYIDDMLSALGIKRAVLVVHDFGGIWGLEWARLHPDKLTGAVLINSGVLIDYVPHPLAVVWSTPGAGEAQMAQTNRQNFRDSLTSANPRLPLAFIERMYDDYDRATRCAALRYYRSAGQNLNLGREQADVLRQRSRPALVIWGRQDPYIPPEQAEHQREAFPSARIEYFDDASHWSFVEEPDRTRALVTSFLRPRLAVGRARGVAGRRRVRVRVRADGALPVLKLRLRLFRRRTPGEPARLIGSSALVRSLSGQRKLSVRTRRGWRLRRGAYLLRVTALGVPRQRSRVLVR